MATYEFRFVVSDVMLTKAQEQKIGQAVGQAGAFALTEITPPQAVSVGLGKNLWWRGIPRPDLLKGLQEFANGQIPGH